jgi:hypothetical protein
MKPYLKTVIGVQLGVLAGGLAVWVGTYANPADVNNNTSLPVSEHLALLLCYSHTRIQPENFNCTDIPLTGLEPTVGNVLASMMSSNLTSVRNQQFFECIDNVCTLSTTDCKPWQTSECSTRILKYEIDQDNKIKSDSFNCIDVP